MVHRTTNTRSVSLHRYPDGKSYQVLPSDRKLVAVGRRFDIWEWTLRGVKQWGQMLFGDQNWSKPDTPRPWAVRFRALRFVQRPPTSFSTQPLTLCT